MIIIEVNFIKYFLIDNDFDYKKRYLVLYGSVVKRISHLTKDYFNLGKSLSF